MTTIPISDAERIGNNAGLLKHARLAMKYEQSRKTIPDRRRSVDLDDWCIYAGDAASPLGFATIEHVGHKRLHLDLLIVGPEHRRKGIGTALLNKVRETAKSDGCDVILCGTLASNSQMLDWLMRREFVCQSYQMMTVV